MDQLLVLAIVAVAVLYLAWNAFGRRKKAGCGGCGGCASEPAGAEPDAELVQIDITPRRKTG